MKFRLFLRRYNITFANIGLSLLAFVYFALVIMQLGQGEICRWKHGVLTHEFLWFHCTEPLEE